MDTFDSLESQRGYLEEKYEECDSIEDLLAYLSFGVVGSAYSIYKYAPTIKRGKIIRSLLKIFNNNRYTREREMLHEVLSQSILIIFDKLGVVFKDNLSADSINSIFTRLPSFISEHICYIGVFDRPEASQFCTKLTQKLLERKIGHLKEIQEYFEDLQKTFSNSISPEKMLLLLHEIDNSWIYLYPHSFARKYNELNTLGS